MGCFDQVPVCMEGRAGVDLGVRESLVDASYEALIVGLYSELSIDCKPAVFLKMV